MNDIIARLDSAINEVKELGLNCETDLWAIRDEVVRLHGFAVLMKFHGPTPEVMSRAASALSGQES